MEWSVQKNWVKEGKFPMQWENEMLVKWFLLPSMRTSSIVLWASTHGELESADITLRII